MNLKSVEMVLHNLPPVAPFVVRWRYSLFRREDGLDPARLKSMGGRPAQYTAETLLECLGNDRLSSGDWERLCKTEYGVSHGKFFELRKQLEDAGKVQKSVSDRRFEKIHPKNKT